MSSKERRRTRGVGEGREKSRPLIIALKLSFLLHDGALIPYKRLMPGTSETEPADAR